MNYLHSVRSCQFWKQLNHESKGPRPDDLVTSKAPGDPTGFWQYPCCMGSRRITMRISIPLIFAIAGSLSTGLALLLLVAYLLITRCAQIAFR